MVQGGSLLLVLLKGQMFLAVKMWMVHMGPLPELCLKIYFNSIHCG